MKNYIRYLDYKVDKKLLLQQANKAKESATGYTDSRYPDMKLSDWKIGHYTSPYIEQIMKDFGVSGKPRFYWMEPFANVPTHIDNGTQCSLNFILTENAAPIKIGPLGIGQMYRYQAALLNTTVPHSVVNNHHERIMLKISIFDETYEEIDTRIPFKMPSWRDA